MRCEAHTSHLFYSVMDMFLGTQTVGGWREKSLSGVAGHTLEVGVGTGLSFSHYPPQVRDITAVDLSPTMDNQAVKRATKAGLTVRYHPIAGDNLPFRSGTFDSVVSQFTLCSIDDGKLQKALREIHRVLKPNGRYFFLEHGLSTEPRIACWQHRITPLQQVFAGGCHLDRDIEVLLNEASFKIDSLERFYYGLKVWGSLYQGVAHTPIAHL